MFTFSKVWDDCPLKKVKKLIVTNIKSTKDYFIIKNNIYIYIFFFLSKISYTDNSLSGTHMN